jgi:putative membrane protein
VAEDLAAGARLHHGEFMSVLKPVEKKRVEAAVTAAELKTSGEIVVAVVTQSGLYRWIYGTCVVLGWAGGTAIAWAIPTAEWGPSALTIITWQGGSIAALWFLIQIPGVRRQLVRKREMAERVHAKSLQLFVESGTLKTKDRTGVLIYVSEFEHRVEILADVGIHSIVGDGYWKDQVDHIVAGIRAGKACDALCEAIGDIGAKLSERFPPGKDNPNELPNAPL